MYLRAMLAPGGLQAHGCSALPRMQIMPCLSIAHLALRQGTADSDRGCVWRVRKAAVLEHAACTQLTGAGCVYPVSMIRLRVGALARSSHVGSVDGWNILCCMSYKLSA